MFTLKDAEETRIRSFISKRMSNTKNELEARLFPPIPDQDITVDYYQFHRVLKRYIYKKELGGFGFRKEFTTQLNVSSVRNPDLRESVKGMNSVKLYWLTGNINDIMKHSPDSLYRMSKKKKDNVDLSNYPVRIALAEEQEIKASETKDFQFLNNNDFPKIYRLQNRVSVYTDDGLFRIDFTTVKKGEGKSFKQSRTVQAFPGYEIEIEYVGDQNVSKDEIFNGVIKNVKLLLTIYHDSPILITNSMSLDVLDKYRLLVRKNERFRKSNRKDARNRRTDFITARPRTLHRENCRNDPRVPNILRNYGVTYKADGVGMLLYIIPDSKSSDEYIGDMFLLDNNFRIIPVGSKMEGWGNSVIEGEYIRDSHTFYAYDMLYAKGLDIRNKPLESFNSKSSSRLVYLKEFVEEFNNTDESKGMISVQEKPYLFGNGEEIFQKSRELWRDREAQPFHVDGLIYTPATDPYPSRPGTWDRLFKWKPPHLNTIDFLVQTVKSQNGKDRLYPYIDVDTKDKRVKETTDYGVTQYKILNLKVGGRTESYNRRTSSLKTGRGAVLFQEAKVAVGTDGKIMAKDPLSGFVQEIMDDTVVEFSYDDDSVFPWKPIRVRHGKTKQYRKYKSNFGNDERIARDIWRSIQIPVTEKMITSGDIPPPSSENEVRYTRDKGYISNTPRLPYQTFHTVYVKDRLLRSVSIDPRSEDRGAGYLIDFGSSRGGDLNRWKDIGYTTVVGIDLDPDSVEQSSLRYERMDIRKDDFRVSFLCGDLTKSIFPNYESACQTSESDTESKNWKEIMKLNIPQKYIFDVVSSQFVIHYAFSDEISIRTYLQNVTDNLRIGGHFIGTTFDGQRIYNSLKRRSSISGDRGKRKIWEITKLYNKKKFVDGKPNFGMAIDVYVGSIGIAHKEYLVSYKYLQNLSLEYGLELVNVTPFSQYWEEGVKSSDISGKIRAMSEAEKQFSFFFSSFTFKKTRQAPETSYRKLTKLKRKAEVKARK